MMRQPTLSTLVLLITLSALPALGQPQEPVKTPDGEPADFREFVEKARSRGASDEAYLYMHNMASIRAQTTLLGFKKLDRGYGMSYSAAFCPRPGADPEEIRKIRAQEAVKEEAEMPTVKRWSDLDGSGFVSSEEALQTLQLFQFGREAASVAQQEKTREGRAVAAAMSMPLPDFLSSYREYGKLVDRHGEDFGPRLSLELPAEAPRP